MKDLVSLLALPESSKYIKKLSAIEKKYALNINVNEKNKIFEEVLEIYMGYFDLDYNLRLSNTYSEDPNEIYVSHLYSYDFNRVNFKIFNECFKRYLDKIYLFKRNRVEDNTFNLVRLISLSNEENYLKYLTLDAFAAFNKKPSKNYLSKVDYKHLTMMYSESRDELIKEISNYTSPTLTTEKVINIFRCMSSSYFDEYVAKNDKAKMLSLLDGYFSFTDRENIRYYLSKVSNETTNVEAIAILYSRLANKGTSASDIRVNSALLDNILSYDTIIKENEIYKANLDKVSKENIIRLTKIR